MKIPLHRKQGERNVFGYYENVFLNRVRSDTDGWCPLNKISSTTYEYLQIDFDNLTIITLIELQGKFSSKPVNSIQTSIYTTYLMFRMNNSPMHFVLNIDAIKNKNGLNTKISLDNMYDKNISYRSNVLLNTSRF